MVLLLSACAYQRPAPVANRAYATLPPVTLPAVTAPGVVTVAAGDTLSGIAQRQRVDMAALAKANNLSAPYNIRAGQTLVLPSGASAAGPAGLPPQVALSAPRAAAPKPAAAPQLVSNTTRPVSIALPPRAGNTFAWPLNGAVVSPFGPKPGGVHNDGIDIRVTRGLPFVAAESGVVAYAGNDIRGLGNLLLIRHAEGWVTAYAHADSFAVRQGDVVARGQVVGKAGATGNVPAPTLHFEIRQGSRAVDPLQYLSTPLVGTLVASKVPNG